MTGVAVGSGTSERVAAPAPAPLRAIFLAFEFPPLASGGVYRSLKAAKYLPALGVELDVVTVRPEDARRWTPGGLDETLGRDLPPSVRVHRIASGVPEWYWRATRGSVGRFVARHAHLGDPLSLFWRRPLLERLDAIVAERRPDVLLATVPPFGVAPLARAAARRYRLPWIVDWRDPWTLWQTAPFPSYAHYRYVRSREGACLREANLSICTSHVTRAEWLDDFRGVDPARLRVVYNGWDPEDLRDVVPDAPAPGRRRITYVGSFYYDPEARAAMLCAPWRRPPKRWLHFRRRREDWLYRSPYFFLRGLRRFADRHPALAATLEVVFAGTVPAWLPAMLEETGTRELVTLRGRVSHAESLALQAGADALLLTSAKVEGRPDYSIAGKTFEYLGLRRPVLGVLTEGAMRDLVQWTSAGTVVDPDDAEAVAEAIRLVAEGRLRRDAAPEQEERVNAFRRDAGARLLAAALREAAAEGYRGGL